jgi:ornithine cyclodeaminase
VQVRDYQRLWLWGRDHGKAQACASALSAKLQREVEVLDSLASASEADVISVATTSYQAIIQPEHTRPGQHLDLVGAFLPTMCEADAQVIKQARVFVDDLEAATAEAGDLILAQQQGWSFDHVAGDLSDLVTGRSKPEAGSISLFKSVGLALEDLAVAKLLI